LLDSNCALGSICTANQCVSGCRDDTGCGDGTVCVAGQCVDGCTTDDDCAVLGTFCGPGRVCVLGCHGSDARCAEGQVCGADDTCVTPCSAQNPCGNGEACLNGTCAAGCLVDDDCGFLAPHCLGATATSTGTCVGCIAPTDCLQGTQCVDNTCRQQCGGGFNFCAQGVCDTAAGLCVDCLADDDCFEGSTCNTATKTCETSEALCAECGGDRDTTTCGAGNLCLAREIARFTVENSCGIDCSAGQACPAGFGCELILRNSVAIGEQCVPRSSVIDDPRSPFTETMSCAAVRDARDASPCQRDSDCGSTSLLDGFCINGACALRCGNNSDCLTGDVCAPVPGDRDASACQ
jgi:hypothetical protein